MKVSVQYAQEHFADLATAASQGAEVEIELPGKPGLKLVTTTPISRPRTPSGRPRRELGGAWEGLVAAPTQEEWDAIHQEFLDSIKSYPEMSGEPS
jgi:antitoxin (DNA-binding transcriptional repressor) of toxin-antitoxin stability system